MDTKIFNFNVSMKTQETKTDLPISVLNTFSISPVKVIHLFKFTNHHTIHTVTSIHFILYFHVHENFLTKNVLCLQKPKSFHWVFFYFVFL